MRKFLILAGLMVVVFTLANSGVTTSAMAATMCTTTCSGSTLCCTPTTSCTSVPGSSITCDGVTTTCSTANSWCACSVQCEINYDNCISGCPPYLACRWCDRAYNLCINNCGPQPPNVCGC